MIFELSYRRYDNSDVGNAGFVPAKKAILQLSYRRYDNPAVQKRGITMAISKLSYRRYDNSNSETDAKRTRSQKRPPDWPGGGFGGFNSETDEELLAKKQVPGLSYRRYDNSAEGKPGLPMIAVFKLSYGRYENSNSETEAKRTRSQKRPPDWPSGGFGGFNYETDEAQLTKIRVLGLSYRRYDNSAQRIASQQLPAKAMSNCRIGDTTIQFPKQAMPGITKRHAPDCRIGDTTIGSFAKLQ